MQQFGRLRSIFWPIHSFELKKFLPTSLLMFSIIFIYSICRDLKDTLIVCGATGGGVEVIGYIKLFAVAPCTIILVMLYIKLANKFNRDNLFYVIICSFLTFFTVFGFILYPLSDQLHLSSEGTQSLQESYPFMHWVWPVLGNWTFSLFFVFAELWGGFVICVLFWQFANSIFKVSEAKRFYVLFSFIGNKGLILSGIIVIICANIAQNSFATNVRYQTLFILLFGIITLVTYKYLAKQERELSPAKEKLKLSFAESLKQIAKSKYLIMIAVIIAAYGISMNLMEVLWKSQAKLLYPSPTDYIKLMGKTSYLIGITTMIFTLVGANIVRLCRWRTAALIPPLILLITGVCFFAALFSKNMLGVVVFVGMVRGVLAKGIKFSVFDATKEMAYIPLGQELKRKGQAVVEVIGAKFGKAGGSTIQIILLTITGGGASISSMSGIIATIVMGAIICWIAAVFSIGKQFENMSQSS